jgi:inhibitor of KinA
MRGLKIQPLGDTGLHIDFQEKVSKELNQKIRSFCKAIEDEHVEGIVELVPAYTSLTLYYLPHQLVYQQIKKKVLTIYEKNVVTENVRSNIISIPTLYGGNVGEDLSRVASLNQIDEEEVIHLHSGTDYLVYMMGFLPGFPYLGGLSSKLFTPRLDNPRSHVPAGSVGVAGEQTGIYPLESPGGWNIIGRTPIKLFDPGKGNSFLFEPGDYIRFVPINEQEYEEIEQEINGR